MIKAIIFDCFGVLVGKGFHEIYRELGGDPSKDRTFIDELLDKANMGKISQKEFRNEMQRQLSISSEEYQRAIDEFEQPNYTILNHAASLHKKYKTAVLSNANVGVLQRKISEEWLHKCFDQLVVSAEVGYIKPQPEIYKLAAQRLGVKESECVFIDDKTVYCDAARQVGMKTIWYQDFDQFKNELEKLLAAGSKD
jgi:putative hydrolase of the HAD superfamily